MAVYFNSEFEIRYPSRFDAVLFASSREHYNASTSGDVSDGSSSDYHDYDDKGSTISSSSSSSRSKGGLTPYRPEWDWLNLSSEEEKSENEGNAILEGQIRDKYDKFFFSHDNDDETAAEKRRNRIVNKIVKNFDGRFLKAIECSNRKRKAYSLFRIMDRGDEVVKEMVKRKFYSFREEERRTRSLHEERIKESKLRRERRRSEWLSSSTSSKRNKQQKRRKMVDTLVNDDDWVFDDSLVDDDCPDFVIDGNDDDVDDDDSLYDDEDDDDDAKLPPPAKANNAVTISPKSPKKLNNDVDKNIGTTRKELKYAKGRERYHDDQSTTKTEAATKKKEKIVRLGMGDVDDDDDDDVVGLVSARRKEKKRQDKNEEHDNDDDDGSLSSLKTRIERGTKGSVAKEEERKRKRKRYEASRRSTEDQKQRNSESESESAEEEEEEEEAKSGKGTQNHPTINDFCDDSQLENEAEEEEEEKKEVEEKDDEYLVEKHKSSEEHATDNAQEEEQEKSGEGTQNQLVTGAVRNDDSKETKEMTGNNEIEIAEREEEEENEEKETEEVEEKHHDIDDNKTRRNDVYDVDKDKQEDNTLSNSVSNGKEVDQGNDRPNINKKPKKPKNYNKKEFDDDWCASFVNKSHDEIFGDHDEGKNNLNRFRKIMIRHHKKKTRRKYIKVALCDVFTMGYFCCKGAECNYSHRIKSEINYGSEGDEDRKIVDGFFNEVAKK